MDSQADLHFSSLEIPIEDPNLNGIPCTMNGIVDFKPDENEINEHLDEELCQKLASEIVEDVEAASLLQIQNRRDFLVQIHHNDHPTMLRRNLSHLGRINILDRIVREPVEDEHDVHLTEENAMLDPCDHNGTAHGLNGIADSMESDGESYDCAVTEDNATSSKRFCAFDEESHASSDDEWQNLTDDLGFMKKMIMSYGEFLGPCPQKHQEVTVVVSVHLLDGTEVQEREMLQFVVSDQEVPYVLDHTVLFMKRLEVCQVIADKEYCSVYGGSTTKFYCEDQERLVYCIELLEIQEGPYSSSASIYKRLNWADAKRDLGNDLYTYKNYETACLAYKKCLMVILQASKEDHDYEISGKLNKLGLDCHNNRAAAFMKLGRWKEALASCEMAEKLDPICSKTLYRKGKILGKLGEFKEAIAALKKAKSLHGNSQSIKDELNMLQKRLIKENKNYRKMCKNMMKLVAKVTAKTPSDQQNKQPECTQRRVSSWIIHSSFFAACFLLMMRMYWKRRYNAIH